jgi:hypothetical protein
MTAPPPGISEADWLATPSAVRGLILAQQEEIQQLRAQVCTMATELASLREQIGRTSRNSSKPPSTNGPGFKPPERRKGSGLFRDNQVGRSTTSTLAGKVSAGEPGANAQGPGDASTTDESPTQLVHGQTTIGQKPGGFCGGGGFLSAQCPPH